MIVRHYLHFDTSLTHIMWNIVALSGLIPGVHKTIRYATPMLSMHTSLQGIHKLHSRLSGLNGPTGPKGIDRACFWWVQNYVDYGVATLAHPLNAYPFHATPRCSPDLPRELTVELSHIAHA